jgi:hypothetical protein
MNLQAVALSSLRPHPSNYNVHDDAQIGELVNSLSRFGQYKNIVVWRGFILAGHGLVEAARKRGDSTIVVEDRSDLSEPDAIALLAADNEIARRARVDNAKLADLVKSVQAQGSTVPGVNDEDLRRIVAEAQREMPAGDAGLAEDAPDDSAADDIDAILAPFPWFGGKARVAGRIWARLGEVDNYVEPFCGSAAVLLACPFDLKVSTINDADGYVANFWRSVHNAPDDVARWADWPVNENDLFARHVWLIRQRGELVRQLETDPDYYDAKIAGWWVWGCCAWIGSGWCAGDGPWAVEDGQVVNVKGNAGRGVNRQLPHLGNAGRGVGEAITEILQGYMRALSDKLRKTRVTCGDWARVVTPSVTFRHGLTGVLLDPPYGDGSFDYSGGGNDDKAIAAQVRQWCVENGDNSQLRIALCGYDDVTMPAGWSALRWKARKGYQVAGNDQSHRETVWFSPHCRTPARINP